MSSSIGNNEEAGSDAIVLEGRPELGEPPKYAVLLHNDDFSTFEFVVEVLKKFFSKSESEANQITLEIHHQGRGIAGVFSCDIAETKVAQVNEYSKSRGFPLKSSSERVE